MVDEPVLEGYSVPLSGTLLDAVETIEHNHSRCTIIIDGGKVVGILSEGDVLRAFLKGADVRAPISEYFNPSFKFLTEFDREAALKLFRDHGITLIPLVDHDLRLTGVVTWKDILDSVSVTR
jgi:arabinose-5-phosphate isomerase